MTRTTVRSSTIKSVGYDETARILEIEFLNGGIYQYSAVPQGIFDSLMGAPSKGKWFSANIKDRYPTRKLAG